MIEPWWIYPLLVLCGFVAGVVNTLAGSGSLLTLPVFLLSGLPPQIANGTNRIGVLIQSLAGVVAFRKAGRLELEGRGGIVGATIFGSLPGAWLASELNPEVMQVVMFVVMSLLLALILINPKPAVPGAGGARWPALMLALLSGLYGGFIQAGVGILLLVMLSLMGNLDLVRANAIKLVCVIAFTLPALILFVLRDQVAWMPGLAVAGGQALGSILAVRFSVKAKGADAWIRALLIALTLAALTKLGLEWMR